MPKSDPQYNRRQVQEVLRRLVTGTKLADVRPVGTNLDSQASESQVSHCLQTVLGRLTSPTQPDHHCHLEFQLWQGSALNAGSVQTSILRSALRTVADVAETERCSRPGGPMPIAAERGLPRRQLLARYLAAEASGDKIEQQLVERVTSYRLYRLSEAALPLNMLHMLTLMYVNEQLELAAQFLHAAWRGSVEDDPEGDWDLVVVASAYRYRIGREAWRLFAQELGIDLDYLIQGNYFGSMLGLCDENLCHLAPMAEQVHSAFENAGRPISQLPTVESLASSWRTLLDQVCGD